MKNTSEATFQADVIDSAEPVIVDFYSANCPPCNRLMPLLHSMASDGLIKIVKLNIDAEPRLTEDFEISALPTLILFRNGQPIKKLVGLQNRAKIFNFYHEA